MIRFNIKKSDLEFGNALVGLALHPNPNGRGKASAMTYVTAPESLEAWYC
jgi:hypothetical protein